MNFSNHNKLTKILSLILVCVLVGTLFAGCKKEEEPADTTENSLGLNLQETNPVETQTQPVETEAAEPNENMGTVTQQMNIRSTPSMQAAILGTLYAGDRVEITRREEVVGHIWGYIHEPEEGWIVMDYVEMDVPTTEEPSSNDSPAATYPTPAAPGDINTTAGTKGVITGNGINIRSEASTDGKIQGSYNKGDVVTILETKNGWARTDKGWVKMDFVNTSGTTGNNTTNNNNTTTNNNNNTTANTNISGNGSTDVVAKGIVRVAELNLRSSASTNGDRLGSLNYGTRVEILEKDGSWGRTSKGWIHLDYVYQDGTTGTKTDNGTVIGEGLRIRSGPGTNYDTLGSYSYGDRVKILEQFTYGNTTWGCTSKGWISLDYVDLDSTDDDDDNDDNDSDVTRIGVITNDLNIREGAGTEYDIVGTYDAGDEVTILETEDGWGRTNKGWISLNYVDFDDSGDDGDEKTGTVTRNLNIRAGAGTEYEIVGGLEAGDDVTIWETRDGWGRINDGWISLNYVDLD